MSFYKIFFNYVLPVLMGYLLGSVSFGVIFSKKNFNQDIREYGSKSSGMTNTIRVYGAKYAVPVFVCDFLKGALPVIIMRIISVKFLSGSLVPVYLAGVFAVIGHIFPLYFGFKGGKGVSTTCGVVAAAQPIVAAICFTLFLIIALATKIVSIGSIIAALSIPLVSYGYCMLTDKAPFVPTVFGFVLAVIIVITHRSNIKRLLKGEEKKLNLHKNEKNR